MSDYEVMPDPRAPAQWIVNGKTVAPSQSDEASAIALFQEVYERPRVPAVRQPLRKDVTRERDRRIAQGQTVTLSDGRSLTLQTRNEQDLRSLDRLMSKALALAMMQKLDTKISLRDADNVMHELTPSQMIECRELVDAQVQAIYQASWDLKALSEIPADFESDEHWP